MNDTASLARRLEQAAPMTTALQDCTEKEERMDVRSIYVECHSDIDILKSLYAAWHKLPACPLLSVIGGAIQEIQALRSVSDEQPKAEDAVASEPAGKEERDELLDDISRLTKQRDRLQTLFDQIYDRNAENHRRAEAAESRIKELEKALEETTTTLEEICEPRKVDMSVSTAAIWARSIEVVRRARAALTKEET